LSDVLSGGGILYVKLRNKELKKNNANENELLASAETIKMLEKQIEKLGLIYLNDQERRLLNNLFSHYDEENNKKKIYKEVKKLR